MNIDPKKKEKFLEMRKNNQALSMMALAIAYGYSYGSVRKMSNIDGFPMVFGKIIPSDFDKWRRAQVKSCFHPPNIKKLAVLKPNKGFNK
jgi:hypothetical protein